MRVVSLLPSATEALCLIGGSHLLVGRSHECDYPPAALHAPVLTAQSIVHDPSVSPADIDRAVSGALTAGRSLYRLDSQRLQELRPDLIITQDLCKVCSIDLESVRRAASTIRPEPRVLALNPATFEDVLDDLLTIGRAVGLEREAQAALVTLRERFFTAANYVNVLAPGPSVAFLEWADPLYVGGHWTPQLIERAGGQHPLNPTAPLDGAGDGAGGQMAHRIAPPSRRISPQELVDSRPERLIICPCGVPLAEVPLHARSLLDSDWFRELPAARQRKVAFVDGNHYFNRPGPRLVDAYEWLVAWLNDRPGIAPHLFSWCTTQGSSRSDPVA